MPARHRHAIVACARWEPDYLVEWLVYHRLIGFDHVYVYCNDDDPTPCRERMLPFLIGPSPFVTFHHFPFPGVQTQMYRHFLRHHLHETEWFIFLDIDEFLVFRADGTVADFLAPRQAQADVIFINWLVFGHAGHARRPPGSVLLNYTRRGREVSHFTKVMTRAAALDAARFIARGETGFWHNWNARAERLHRVVNVIGDDMSGYYADAPASARAYLDQGDRQQRVIAAATINHYQFRAEDEIARRMQRGIAADFHGQAAFRRVLETGTLAEFLAPFNEIEDATLRDVWRWLLDARATSVIARPSAPNIALGKPATQSSVSPWSRGATPEEDAANVVSGIFAGSYNCHTAEEAQPWWRVDLLAPHLIRQIQIFNRVDADTYRLRAGLFALESSLDGETWEILAQTGAPQDFGGVDGRPLIWSSEHGVYARHVRFRLRARGVLHLDAVEIYEAPMERAAVDPIAYGPLAAMLARKTASA